MDQQFALALLCGLLLGLAGAYFPVVGTALWVGLGVMMLQTAAALCPDGMDEAC